MTLGPKQGRKCHTKRDQIPCFKSHGFLEVLPPGLRGLGETVPRLYNLVRIAGLLFEGLTAIFLQQAGEEEARRFTTLIHVFLALGKTEVEIAKKKSLSSFRFSDSF